MPDNRVYVVKNMKNVGVYSRETNVHDGPVYEYVTRSDGRGVSRGTPVGFSKDWATLTAEAMGLDPEVAVIVAPDDMVVALHESARKMPQHERVVLAQFTTGVISA